MKTVVVTGIGTVSPLGASFSYSWDAAKKGNSGIGAITRFDSSRLPWKVGGELKGFNAGAYFSEKEIRNLDPFVQYAVAASFMAAEDAGLLKQSAVSNQQPEKMQDSRKQKSKIQNPKFENPALTCAGIVIGSSRGGITTIEKSLTSRGMRQNSGFRTRVSPYLMPSTTISMAASYAAQKLGIKGNCLGISNACASGANAIGEAFRLIRSGYSEIMLAGGAESPLCRLCVEGYGDAGALSRNNTFNTPRPFDVRRDGFVLSEGACILVLEASDSASDRGAKIYGEIAGYGNTSDAFHMTRPSPEGEAAAIRIAVDDAGISCDEIDYISTHGTATEIGDLAEAEALRIVFGKRAAEIPATAIKSMTGHMLAASGALEIAFSLMSVKEGVIPPTINIEKKDPACDINIVTEGRNAEIITAISNSSGFGGVNAAIAVKKSKSK